jgi:hypothetical protein
MVRRTLTSCASASEAAGQMTFEMVRSIAIIFTANCECTYIMHK